MRFWIIYLIVINVVSFALFGIDKRRAIKHAWRISERTLFVIASIGGSMGALFGMILFRHKTLHKTFTIGIPVILMIQIIIVIVIALR